MPVWNNIIVPVRRYIRGRNLSCKMHSYYIYRIPPALFLYGIWSKTEMILLFPIRAVIDWGIDMCGSFHRIEHWEDLKRNREDVSTPL